MKKNIFILFCIVLISCSPNFRDKFEVIRNDKTYKILVCYYTDNKDSLSIGLLLSYQIKNNTNTGVKFFRFRKRPEYSVQTALMKSNDSLEMFDRLVNKNSSREIIFYCTKIVSINDFPINNLAPEKASITYGEFESNITKIPKEQIKFRNSEYFKNILKEIENDSIAIVFRDTVADDYFQFKGVIKDKKLKFSR
jgi:hypothetical protein